MTRQIEHLIVKYLNQEASAQEMDELAQWLKEPGHAELFQSYIRTNFAIDHIMKDFNTEDEKIKLLTTIREVEKAGKVRKLWVRISGVAASVLVLVSLFLLFNNEKQQGRDDLPIIVDNQIEPVMDKATLTLETGEEISLEEGRVLQTSDITGNEKGLEYREQESGDRIVYNYLTVPRGGQFFIKLSDGTKVWLNSESRLKYPVAFPKGQSRQVELVYGEAYFDVSPNTEHNGLDFKVLHDRQQIQVLGTEFNVKAYKGEKNVYTTLVEGEVQISTPTEKYQLLPSQQAVLHGGTNIISIGPISVREEISWVNGEFIIKQKTLKEIMKVLSRWYDMDVVFENKELEDVKFVGVIRKNQEITEILNTIKNYKIIKNYEIHEQTITIR
ncbi:FecR family protein [Maribacter sp. X9]|uniref:FecR family protein n=1 Tax=Maribacter sp. X9 TaxID=3402159 RepID=UPI003AF359A7